MDKDLILKAILASTGITVSNKRADILQISCPVYYSDSDPFSIYLEEVDGQFWLFDSGETIARIEDVKMLSEIELRKIKFIISAAGGVFINGDIRLSFWHDTLGFGLLRFIQLLSRIELFGEMSRFF